MNPGDLLGTGTLSAPHDNGLGSLLEKTHLGAKPFRLSKDSPEQTFLRDGDSVKMTAKATSKNGYSIGFGECEGSVLPAIPL